MKILVIYLKITNILITMGNYYCKNCGICIEYYSITNTYNRPSCRHGNKIYNENGFHQWEYYIFHKYLCC